MTEPTPSLSIAPVDGASLSEAQVEAMVDELLALYAAVQEAVAGTDNDPEWIIGTHPSREALRAAAADGTLVVAREEGRVAAAFVMNGECAPGYEAAPWEVAATPDEVAVIHLLAVRPDLRGRGLAAQLMDAAARIARERGKRAIRLDTLVGNRGAQRTYERLGFSCRGRARLDYGTYENPPDPRFMLYELAL